MTKKNREEIIALLVEEYKDWIIKDVTSLEVESCRIEIEKWEHKHNHNWVYDKSQTWSPEGTVSLYYHCTKCGEVKEVCK